MLRKVVLQTVDHDLTGLPWVLGEFLAHAWGQVFAWRCKRQSVIMLVSNEVDKGALKQPRK